MGLFRKILWVAFVLTSLPIHFLYTPSCFPRSLHGMHMRFWSMRRWKLRYLGLEYVPIPDRARGVNALYYVLAKRLAPGICITANSAKGATESFDVENLSNPDCRGKYELDVYSNYRTVIQVTDWTQNLPPNNSALAIGALPEFPSSGVRDRFMLLCPGTHLSITPGSSSSSPLLWNTGNLSFRTSVRQI